MDTRETMNSEGPAPVTAAQRPRPDEGEANDQPRQDRPRATTDSDTGAELKKADVDRDRDQERPSDKAPSEQALVEPTRARGYRERWTAIQAVFVDQPGDAVQKADALVDEVVRELTDAFGRERADLEQQWSSGEKVSTEQLRVALQRYRSFFEQLLSA